MPNSVVHMSLEEFRRGLVLPPRSDDVSITGDGRRLDSQEAVLSWWADVAAEIEAESGRASVNFRPENSMTPESSA